MRSYRQCQLCRQTRYPGRHIGEALVKDCLTKAKEKGSAIMQFNAVVATNASAIHLYEKLDFVRLGVIPKGYKKNA
ncbi:MAG: GNAT family N-acetyltransferase [Erysipelotrichaceae bacterium]